MASSYCLVVNSGLNKLFSLITVTEYIDSALSNFSSTAAEFHKVIEQTDNTVERIQISAGYWFNDKTLLKFEYVDQDEGVFCGERGNSCNTVDRL